ncbi:monooxygenase 2-like [Fagus crenata]
MEVVEDIVIVGAGIAGLTTSLGLHKLGIRSLVLESSDDLRTTGYALTLWTNAWKALDAVGIGDSLRHQHERLDGNVTASTLSGLKTSDTTFKVKGNHGDHEVRRVRRNMLLEALAKELPSATVRYSSKVVSIEESSFYKLVHLADGTTYKTKVLIGCDGVNSGVARWLGFKKPASTGRFSIRGFADFKDSHGFEPKSMQFFGNGVRFGFVPCDDNTVYWFFTSTPSNQEKEREHSPAKMKHFVLSKLGKVPDQIRAVIEKTEQDSFIPYPIRYRYPWELLWANKSKGNVCVAGDALHAMTPEIGQGGCASLEDGVVLARCIAKALSEKTSKESKEKDEYKRIEMGLKKYAKERKWRSIKLICTAYIVGFIQQSDGKIMTFFRDKVLSAFLAGLQLKMADFDCGKLSIS